MYTKCQTDLHPGQGDVERRVLDDLCLAVAALDDDEVGDAEEVVGGAVEAEPGLAGPSRPEEGGVLGLFGLVGAGLEDGAPGSLDAAVRVALLAVGGDEAALDVGQLGVGDLEVGLVDGEGVGVDVALDVEAAGGEGVDDEAGGGEVGGQGEGGVGGGVDVGALVGGGGLVDSRGGDGGEEGGDDGGEELGAGGRLEGDLCAGGDDGDDEVVVGDEAEQGVVEAEVAGLGVDVDEAAVRGEGVAADDLPGGADRVAEARSVGLGMHPFAGFGGREELVVEDGLGEGDEVDRVGEETAGAGGG